MTRTRLMITVASALLFLTFSKAHAEPLPDSTQHYELSAELDPRGHAVRGSVQISLRNTASAPLHELVLHTYMNAFASEHSVFMRESGGSLRGETATGKGDIRLRSLTIRGKDALAKSSMELVRGDRTQLRVPLDEPLEIGDTLTLSATFIVHLPPVFARAGYAGDFFAVSQWFPKLAKLEADGTFAAFPYYANGEFYADFADYTLTVKTPADYVVGASGTLVEERKSGAHTVRRYDAKHVIDAAWVCSRALERKSTPISGVQVELIYPPGYERAAEEHLAMVRAGLLHFSTLYGPYPYSTLTVVLPPRGAEGAAGMEYPTLFLSDGPWLTFSALPDTGFGLVTAHELAHEWFYAVLASNEVEHPVLDEGLAEWSALELMRTRFGADVTLGSWLSVDRFELERLMSLAFEPWAAPGLAAYAYSQGEYGASVYGRAAIVLETIRRAYGQRRFRAALGKYAREQRFRHPTGEDLTRAFDETYGDAIGERVLAPLLFEGKTSSVRLVEAAQHEREKTFLVDVLARRSGDVALPTWIAAYDANGRELQRIRWPSHIATLRTTLESKVRVARVVADPDRALLVDDDARDQVIPLKGEQRSLTTTMLGWAELMLSWVGP